MRQFRVHCPSCGRVLVKAQDITVSGLTCYFECPSCGDSVHQSATARETEILAAQGAEVRPDASEPPPLTMDDVITLHQLLQDENWMQHLLTARTRAVGGIPATRAPRPRSDRHDR